MNTTLKGKFLAGRLIRFVATVAGVGLVVWVLLFSGITPRHTIFEIGDAGSARASEYRKDDLARLRLLTRCIGHIRSTYVVPDRVRPMPMMAGALKAAEALVPDLMVTFDDRDVDKATSVEVRIGDLTKVFTLERIKDLYQMNWRLVDIFEFISPNLPPDVKPEEVEYAAINGMLRPLDEHSIFLPPEAYEQMQLDTQGRFGGLGIVISSRNGYVTVMSVMEDTPAYRAALKTGDQIVEIDGESTMNMPLTEAVSKLRGEPGTTVSLVIERKGWSDPRRIKIERAEIKVQSVRTESLGNGIGYAKLVHFQEDTAAELARQLDDLRRRGSLKGLVLDLRQNPGGLLDQAVSVGDLFLRAGTLVVTEGEGGRMRQAFDADKGDRFENLPLVALVDGGSASAAEIVAGALKYNDRAIILGSTTFGKGTVQIMHEVGDGALKLTVAQYLIPGDLSIQGVGVIPDIELVPTSIGSKNILMGLFDYKRFMDPKRRLDAFGKTASDIPAHVIQYLLKSEDVDDDDNDVLEELPVEEESFKRDECIDLAASIIAATVSFADVSRRSQLRNGESATMDWKAVQDKLISAALKEKGVDWTAGPVSENAMVSVAFSSSEKQMKAGDQASLEMSVTNRGEAALYRVRGSMKSDNMVLDGREFVFGRIDPGQTVTRQVQFKVPRETWQRFDEVEIDLYQNAVEPVVYEDREHLVEFVSLDRPRFGYSEVVLDREGNGDGLLNPGEKAELVFVVTNAGTGDAPRVMASISNRSGENLYLRSGRETVKDGIRAGQSRPFHFQVERKAGADTGKVEPLKVEFSVFDLAIREYLAEEVVLPSADAAGPAFASRPARVRTLKPDVKILAAAMTGASVLTRVPEGTILRSSGYFPGFFKVDMADGLVGFVVSTDVMELGEGSFEPSLPAVGGAFKVAPELDVKFVRQEGNSIRVTGKVVFQDDGSGTRKILVFRDNDKVFFWTGTSGAGGDDGVVNVDTTVTLNEGRNALAVYAIEGRDRSAVKRFNIHLPEISPAVAPAGKSVGGTAF